MSEIENARKMRDALSAILRTHVKNCAVCAPVAEGVYHLCPEGEGMGQARLHWVSCVREWEQPSCKAVPQVFLDAFSDEELRPC